ncbi:MAG: hypothetical protein Q9182_001045 [Xanthomendoza sp. 2 TL-2023]
MLAWLHAYNASWPDFQAKLPPGTVWTSPNKPDGYVRKSVLLELWKRTGEELPKDLIHAGVFEDPDSSNKVADEVGAIRMAQHFKAHLEGKRDDLADDVEEYEDSDDEDEDEGSDASEDSMKIEWPAAGFPPRETPKTPSDTEPTFSNSASSSPHDMTVAFRPASANGYRGYT